MTIAYLKFLLGDTAPTVRELMYGISQSWETAYSVQGETTGLQVF